MEITIYNTPVMQLKQLDVVVPSVAGKYMFRGPNTVIVHEVTPTQGEILAIEGFQFDPCLAYDGYDPALVNNVIRHDDRLRAMIAPMVGSAPSDMFMLDFISERGGLDGAGLIMPLASWWPEPQFYTEFKASPCYTP